MATETYRGDAAGRQASESVDIFERQWRLYQKVAVELDFLAHRALFSRFEALLRSLPAAACSGGSSAAACGSQQGVSLLDLGCGDCSCTAAALRATRAALTSFTGVDVTANALALARKELSSFLPAACELTLVQQDLVQYVEECTRRYDVILASFAVHHLGREDKASFLGNLASCLAPGGVLALIDVFKADGESRDVYMERLRRHLDAKLTDDRCTAEERETLWAHIYEFDFPEDLSSYQQMAAAAGFASCECAYVDPANFFRLLLLRAPVQAE